MPRARIVRTVAHLAAAVVLLAACDGGDPYAAGSAATGAGASPASATVTVALPNVHSLQWLSFWVAVGADHFHDEGLDVEVVSPPHPFDTPSYLTEGEADVAVLPPPLYLTAMAEGHPVVVFANLLRNDPVNLVVRPEVAEQRGLTADMSLAERLEAMQGLKVGVAPGPPTRLRILFGSVGLDADRDIEMVIVHGGEQNAAFGEGRIDALYAHTPYLERALVDQGAVTIVDQIGGEVPELSGFVRHALVTTEDYARANPHVLVALTRGVHRAQRLVHTDLPAAGEAVRRSGVEVAAPGHLDTMLRVYQPAIPETPEVSVEGVRRNLELLPATFAVPDLSDEDLAAHVDTSFAREAVLGSR